MSNTDTQKIGKNNERKSEKMIENQNNFLMYIRSQNQEELIPILLDDEFGIISENPEIKPKQEIGLYSIIVCGTKLGTYLRRKTSIEVLDKIQKKLLVSLQTYGVLKADDYIFEMPLDEDVSSIAEALNKFAKAFCSNEILEKEKGV